MNTGWIAVPLLLTAVALGLACSDDDDSGADLTPTHGPGSNGQPNGSSELGDFPVPVPDWADALSVSESGPLQVALFAVPVDRQDATVAFYEEWIAEQDDEFVRTEGQGGGVSFQSDAAVGEEKTTITILSPAGSEDFGSVSIAVGVFE